MRICCDLNSSWRFRFSFSQLRKMASVLRLSNPFALLGQLISRRSLPPSCVAREGIAVFFSLFTLLTFSPAILPRLLPPFARTLSSTATTIGDERRHGSARRGCAQGSSRRSRQSRRAKNCRRRPRQHPQGSPS